MPYQVLTRTYVDGWANLWHDDVYGAPWVFDTIEEAQAEIDDLLQEMPDYDADDYRIERVQP
jgi:hypothetical protein